MKPEFYSVREDRIDKADAICTDCGFTFKIVIKNSPKTWKTYKITHKMGTHTISYFVNPDEIKAVLKAIPDMICGLCKKPELVQTTKDSSYNPEKWIKRITQGLDYDKILSD